MTMASTAGAAPRVASGRAGAPQLIVDRTLGGRRVTGLERVTNEMFGDEALAPFTVEGVTAASRTQMVLRQTFALPALALRRRDALVLCPGFPPTPALTLLGDRVIPYIHDTFLITRTQDLNIRAKLYMTPSFRFAVTRLKRFFVNSEYTRDELRRFCPPDAEIQLYRPPAKNVFGLSPGGRAAREDHRDGPRLIALGTVEPRKNLLAAARIVAALHARGLHGARLDIVGRVGWGEEIEELGAAPGVTIRGYQPAETVRALVDEADAMISTSHDEGLGLPLIEAQYAGLPVIAPGGRVFREALRESGVYIATDDPAGAAAAILGALSGPNWRARAEAAALANVARWNAAAAQDHSETLELLARHAPRRSAAAC